MAAPKNLRRVDRLRELKAQISELANKDVLVGFPEETNARDDDGAALTNAVLAYIHDNGAPEQNIPARPFMYPGMNAAVEDLGKVLVKAARNLLKPARRDDDVERYLTQAGIVAVTSIKKTIVAGIPPPLADATLRERLRRHKGRQGEKLELTSRSLGNAPSTEYAKPLIDTGQLYRAVTFVIRARKRRRTR